MESLIKTAPRKKAIAHVIRCGMAMPIDLARVLDGKHQMKNVVKGLLAAGEFESHPFPAGKKQVYYRFSKEAASSYGLPDSYSGPLRLSKLRASYCALEFCWHRQITHTLLMRGALFEFDERLAGISLSTRMAVTKEDPNGHTFSPRLSPLRLDFSGKDPAEVIARLLSLIYGTKKKRGWAANHPAFSDLITERKFHPYIITPSSQRRREIEAAIHHKNRGRRPLPFPVSVVHSEQLKHLF